MKQLELKHLAPYLPYGLKMSRNNFIGELITIKNDKESIAENCEFQVSCSNWWENNTDSNHYKPILYPLDYLTKEIIHNGETFVPIEWLEEKYYTLDLHKQCERLLEEDGVNWINQSDYMLVEQLIEWRFDVFTLIPDGLAIPVTEDFNPYK